MAKAWNTLRGRECAALARELLGGNGVVVDYHVAKVFADMEVSGPSGVSVHLRPGTLCRVVDLTSCICICSCIVSQRAAQQNTPIAQFSLACQSFCHCVRTAGDLHVRGHLRHQCAGCGAGRHWAGSLQGTGGGRRRQGTRLSGVVQYCAAAARLDASAAVRMELSQAPGAGVGAKAHVWAAGCNVAWQQQDRAGSTCCATLRYPRLAAWAAPYVPR